MLVTRISVSLTRFIAPPGKPVFGILASQRGGPLDRDLAVKWLKKSCICDMHRKEPLSLAGQPRGQQ